MAAQMVQGEGKEKRTREFLPEPNAPGTGCHEQNMGQTASSLQLCRHACTHLVGRVVKRPVATLLWKVVNDAIDHDVLRASQLLLNNSPYTGTRCHHLRINGVNSPQRDL